MTRQRVSEDAKRELDQLFADGVEAGVTIKVSNQAYEVQQPRLRSSRDERIVNAFVREWT